MDAHESVAAKVQSIFEELVGARAVNLRGNVAARQANDVLGQALAAEHGPLQGDEMAFHLVDWNSDAAFVVAFLLFPERFTADELRAAVDMFLVHVPAHILAAARLGEYEAEDIFLNDDAT